MELPSPKTALSLAVRKLLCTIGDDEANVLCSINSDGQLIWNNITTILPLIEENTSAYYEQAVRALSPIFAQCEQFVDKYAESDLAVISSCLIWTNCQQLFLDCLNMLVENKTSSPKSLLALLLMSAALERALGNVYLTHGVQCPSMLKDLLITEELTQVLGITVLQTLRILIGPPTSLNLRNVAWHGFLGDTELPRRYCCFLFLLGVSISKILSNYGLNVSQLPHRPFVTWPENISSRMLTCGTPFSKENLNGIYKMLVSSSVAQPQTCGQWRLVFDLYLGGRYGYCLAMILQLLEHCLRRLFASLNNCPERVLTAESSALYTTFNEMLEKYLPDGKVNQLPIFLGDNCMDLLLDLLFYQDGPRLRDHLSHGEADFLSISYFFVDPFIHLAVYLAHQVSECFTNSVKSNEFNYLVAKVKDYTSQFHPIAVFQQKVNELLFNLELKTDCSFVLLSSSWEGLGQDEKLDFIHENSLLRKIQEKITALWHCQQWNQTLRGLELPSEYLPANFKIQLTTLKSITQKYIPTLFRWKTGTARTVTTGMMKESEFVGLLQRVTEECSMTVQQLHHMLQLRHQQLHAKELRSRQRENLKKLLICFPCLQLFCLVVAAAVSWNIQHIPVFTSISPVSSKALQRHLKLLLQQCENLRVLTSPEKNKWSEGVDLALDLLTKLQQFMLEWKEKSPCV